MARLQELQRELAHLRAQNQELMHINNEWDKEYREQREAFRRYQADSQQAQTENHAVIARLKEKVAALEGERDGLEDELSRYQRELHALRERLAVAESMRTGGGGGGGMGVQEEMMLLRQQLKAYEEDFDAEKREKERLREEKQSAVVRFEAEKTSLQLRLDRCQTDLAHFTAEANRLAQQLKLKNQYEEDRYLKHLESQGFVSRSGGGIPPLDPYVEIDQNVPTIPPSHHHDRVVERHDQHGPLVVNGRRTTADQTMPNGTAVPVANGRLGGVGSGGTTPGGQRRTAPSNSSWRLVPRGAVEGGREKTYSSPQSKTHSDGASIHSTDSSSSGSCDSLTDDRVGGVDHASHLGPARGTKHSCPRCARRFVEKVALEQHKDKCLA